MSLTARVGFVPQDTDTGQFTDDRPVLISSEEWESIRALEEESRISSKYPVLRRARSATVNRPVIIGDQTYTALQIFSDYDSQTKRLRMHVEGIMGAMYNRRRLPKFDFSASDVFPSDALARRQELIGYFLRKHNEQFRLPARVLDNQSPYN